ncbi:cytochrome c oxidase assembly protein [Mycobacterium sp. shizuoka-1]|uniref:cytochrome c oxidase assembly protein n=1 Tax=Mycobacterium sp. shizuoka-1 TaxID=2039281 RepID=UPI000C05DFAA|nr:cytochrome c oxidase assembly protein [Mycobacterium sp. shizuoka-1]GAY14791.1 hypothetical protein MSZK_15170 [Mycobacterium sp. shizuoka-1]
MVVGSWTLDPVALAVIATLSAAYLHGRRRIDHATVGRGRLVCFLLGIAVWAAATFSAVGAYAPVLFWDRALQVLLLILVCPFLLALGRPVTVLFGDRVARSRAVRVLGAPLTTSAAMLATPWLLYLTPWYVVSMTGPPATATRLVLVVVGFGYFYARLQSDPVPRRLSPLVSIGISVVESLGDGVLGVVLWLGPLIAVDYYTALQRNWGPSLRIDQSIGAGILWIAGDVLSIPFVLVLLHQLGSHERRRAERVDAELDETPQPSAPGLWWQSDPQLKDRFG